MIPQKSRQKKEKTKSLLATQKKGLFATLADYLSQFWNWIMSFIRKTPAQPTVDSSNTQDAPPAVLVESAPRMHTLAAAQRAPLLLNNIRIC